MPKSLCRYAWIKEQQTDCSISLLCRFLKVSRSGYYDWLDREKSDREKQDQVLKEKLKSFFLEGRGVYGSRRLKQKLAQTGLKVSRRRVSRLMKGENLLCKTVRQIKATTDSNHNKPIAANLFSMGWVYTFIFRGNCFSWIIVLE